MEISPVNALDLLLENEAVELKEFRKSNEAVTIRVRTGPTLSLMGRRLFNALVFHAQQFGRTGVDAPEPFDACENPNDFYWIGLPDLVEDSSWGSKDHKLVAVALQQLQATLVESESNSSFSSVQLLGGVHIRKGSGRRQTLVGWEFPKSTRDILSNPNIYTTLSIHHLTSLSTIAATTLYEVGMRYLTNPGNRTSKEHWQWWHDVLTGKKIGSVNYPEYRYFKRDTLMPAIAEVNRTDIRVELSEFKIGRSIRHLQFTIQQARQASLALAAGPVIDATLIARLLSLGFTEKQANDMVFSHETHYLRATLTLVETRIRDVKMEAIKSPTAFMRKALKDDYVATTKPIPQSDASPIKAKNLKDSSTIADKQRGASVEAALKDFEAMNDEERTRILNVFGESSSTIRRLKKSGVAYQRILGNWLIDNANLNKNSSLLG